MAKVKSGKDQTENRLKQTIENSRKFVIKIGSNVLTDSAGEINQPVMRNIVRQVNHLIKRGAQVVLVSSGARSAGFGRLHKWKTKASLNRFQALCAVGQIELMKHYQRCFARYNRQAAQMLLINDDFDDRLRYLNIRNTLTTLLNEGIVPIVNENDSVSTDEIRIGDNDNLAALITTMWNADVLVLMSNIDGIYGSKDEDGRRQLIQVIHQAEDLEKVEDIGRSKWGSGGIVSKLEAARSVGELNIPAIVLNGLEQDVLIKILDGKHRKGTVIMPWGKGVLSKKRWLAHAKRPRGKLVIDSGAVEALAKKGRSLLAVGIESVEGNFSAGDLVSIVSGQGNIAGRGLVQYSSGELEKIVGRKVSEIEATLGYKTFDEVIHRDNMVIF
jgi:glutamate 5-kinase